MVLRRLDFSGALAALLVTPLLLAAKCDGPLSLGGDPNARRAEAGAGDACDTAGCDAGDSGGAGALAGTGGGATGGKGGGGSGGAHATGGAGAGGKGGKSGADGGSGAPTGVGGIAVTGGAAGIGTGGSATSGGMGGAPAGGKSGGGGMDTGFVVSCANTDIVLEPSDFCDGVAKCPDASDEYGCPHPFACDDGSSVSIRDSQICDYTDDCADGTDEAGCVRYEPWQCQDGTEIRTAQLCDTYFDCPDHSDEGHCTTGDQTICTAGFARALAYDADRDCLMENVPIGCAELIPPPLTVPTDSNTSGCARRKRDGLLAMVPSPVWATDWDDCSDDEAAKFVGKGVCP